MILKPITPEKSTGFITLPAETGQDNKVLELIKLWGADAIRDSDGTELSPQVLDTGNDIYSTVCIVRADQQWPRQHSDQVHQKYLMSDPLTSVSDTLTIPLLNGFHPEKYEVDRRHDPKTFWQVHDRTTGELVSITSWEYDETTGSVVLTDIPPYHVYTVNFLASVIWDTTSMYNHVVNKWDKPHVISVDPYYRETWDHLMKFYEAWLNDHPSTTIVRLTTLAYHFNVDFDENAQDKFRDWVGYQETLSMPALLDFEKVYGYRLTPEDFVDQGYYNATVRVPSDRYLDWMEFIQRFVVTFGKELVKRANQCGKKTAIFHGDHWIGIEPFSPNCEQMGIDMHVGAAEDGVALRRVSDTPGMLTKEVRLYPYFFPDVFKEGGDQLSESISNWIKIRRAIMRKGIDRIGYGGYLSLAAKFPEFIKHVGELCNEFRAFKIMADGTESQKYPIKVGVLNAWGKWRSWINSFGREQKFLIKRQDVIQVAGTNLLECLAGLPVEVEFLSMRDIKRQGVPDHIDVIINDGDPETSWSGGRFWGDPDVSTALRCFVAKGGGFIGCRGPTACPYQGRYFQLSDVMGIEKENSLSIQNASIKFDVEEKHYITEDLPAESDFDHSESFVFVNGRHTKVLKANQGHVTLAINTFGEGRSVYLAELPYSLENSRLLLRSILWSANKESALNRWSCSNINTDCAYYPKKSVVVIVNNSTLPQETIMKDGDGAEAAVILTPYESKWFEI